MSRRLRLARKYGSILRPRLLKFTSDFDFQPVETEAAEFAIVPAASEAIDFRIRPAETEAVGFRAAEAAVEGLGAEFAPPRVDVLAPAPREPGVTEDLLRETRVSGDRVLPLEPPGMVGLAEEAAADWCDLLGLNVPPEPAAGPAPEPQPGVEETLRRLSELEPEAFEQAVAEALRRQGWDDVFAAGRPRAGIDIVATRIAPGTRELIGVRCVRGDEVGEEPARELLAAVAAHPPIARGLLVVSGQLAPPCRDFVESHGKLDAIEGRELAERLIELGIPL